MGFLLEGKWKFDTGWRKMQNGRQEQKEKGGEAARVEGLDAGRSGLRVLVELSLGQPKQLMAVIGIGLLGGLIVGPIPYIAKVVIDRFVADTGMGAVASVTPWKIGGIVALLIGSSILLKVTSALCSGWQSYHALRISRNALYDLRLKVVTHLMGAKQPFFEKVEPAYIASRITHDVNNMDSTIFTVLRNVVAAIFTLFTVVGFMVWMDVWLTVAILVTLPATAVASYFAFRAMRIFNLTESNRVADLNVATTEVFHGIKILRVFNAESFFLKRLADRCEALRFEGIQHWTVFHTTQALILLLSNLGGDIFIIFGGMMTLLGEITFGEFFAFYSYQSMLWAPVGLLLNLGAQTQAGAASAQKVEELTQVPLEEYLLRSEEREEEGFSGEIEARGLCFSYQAEDPVLREIDFHLPAGSMTALVGQSGSGKTTLANLLTGLHLPTDGSLQISGKEVRDWDLERLRSRVGIVLQEPILFHDSIRANVRLGKMSATDDEVLAALHLAHLGDFVRNLPDGLDTMVGVGGARLSGGQKQRIAIARVFLKNPKLLILDEATSALDGETERAIQRSFDALMVGRTAIVIAHRLSTILQANQILVLHQGRLVESGTHQELFALSGGIYRNLFDAQMQGLIPMSGATRRPWVS